MIRSLTGIRFFAAIWVVLLHMLCVPIPEYDLWLGRTLDWGTLENFARFGASGVDLFFVLSGFVMALAHRHDFCRALRWRSYLRYVVLRFGRIYPVHLFLLIYMLLMHHYGQLVLRPAYQRGLVYQLTLTHGWVPESWFWDLTWNLPAWSISVEWFAYLHFPLGMRLVSAISQRPIFINHTRLYHGLLLALCAGLAWWYAHELEFENVPWHLGRWGLIRVFCGFWIGVAVHELWRTGFMERLDWGELAAGLVALVLSYCIFPAPARVTILLLSSLMIFALARGERGPLVWLLSSRPIVGLGKVSYGIYMLHFPALISLYSAAPHWLQHVAGQPSHSLRSGVILGVIASIVVLAILLHYGVEEPARRWFRRLAERIDPPRSNV